MKTKSILTTSLFLLLLIIATSGITKGKSERYNSNNLVVDFYTTETTKNKELETIEKSIENFYDKKEAAENEYNTFQNYNSKYYTDVKNQANAITDSNIKQQAFIAIQQSENGYKAKIEALVVKLNQLKANEIQLRSYHELLKIKISIPVIETYQNDNEPKATIFDANNVEVQKIIEAIKKLTN